MSNFQIEVRQTNHFPRLIWDRYTKKKDALEDFEGLINNPNMTEVLLFEDEQVIARWELSPIGVCPAGE